MQTELILYALIAAGLVYWLRSILGTRHGQERERPNPFTTMPSMDKKTTDKALDDIVGELGLEQAKPALPKNVFIADKTTQNALDDLARVEEGFDVAKFSQNAQDAFAIVVEAFGAGDRETLKDLVEPQVYAAFDGALVAREKAGESMVTEIHAIRRAEIMAARQDGKKAFVTIRFIADETCVVKNKGGEVISGNPDRVTEMNDIWVFAKPLKSRDPRWFVAETRDGDVKEEFNSVPETL